MPRLDGTGPEGKGPKTGRGMGNCRSDEQDIDNQEELPRGAMFGRGRGRRGGRGRGNI